MEIEKLVSSIALGIIGIIVLFYLIGGLAPTFIGAANFISNTSENASTAQIPLLSLFSPSGIVGIILVVGILITVIAIGLKRFKGD